MQCAKSFRFSMVRLATVVPTSAWFPDSVCVFATGGEGFGGRKIFVDHPVETLLASIAAPDAHGDTYTEEL